MFTKIKEVKVQDETKIKELEQQIKTIKEENERELSLLKEDNERAVNKIIEDYESKERISKDELKIKINEAIANTETENTKLKEENAVLKKEISIIEKAFDNMGFDVKDMKGILEQLVKAIVSKNEIKIVK